MLRFIKDLSAMTFVNLVVGILGVAAVPIALRSLGASGYGLYSVFAVLSGYLLIVELGLGKNLVRVLGHAASEESRTRAVQVALGVYVAIPATLLVLSPLLMALVLDVMFRVPVEARSALRWIAIVAALDYTAGIPVSLRINNTLADNALTCYARFNLASNLVRFAILFAALIVSHRPEVVVTIAASRRLVDLGLAPLLLPALPRHAWRPRFDFHEARSMVARSSLLGVGQLLQLSVVAIGSMLVNGVFGLRELGVYRSTFDLASKFWFISGTVATVLYPKFVSLLGQGDGSTVLRRTLPVMMQVSWLAYCAVGAGVAIVCGVLIRLGSPLLPSHAYTLFALLLCGVLWNAHGNMSGELLQASGRFERLITVAGLSLLLLTLLFFGLKAVIPSLAIGVAWATSQLLAAVVIDVEALTVLGAARTALRTMRQRALPSVGVVLALLGCTVASASVTLFGAASFGVFVLGGVLLALEERMLLAEWWRGATVRLTRSRTTAASVLSQEARDARGLR
jgi:O-antigen/teichoic acid export membrane protein